MFQVEWTETALNTLTFFWVASDSSVRKSSPMRQTESMCSCNPIRSARSSNLLCNAGVAGVVLNPGGVSDCWWFAGVEYNPGHPFLAHEVL